MCKGFIKLDRSIFEHWIFQDAEKFRAFVDLIQLARWKDEKLLIGNEVVIIPRGSYYTSELKLAERWGWSRNKTREFLKLLENEKMITKKGTPKGTTLTIENYRVYQDEGTTKDTTESTSKGTSNGQQKVHQTDNERYTKEESKEREEIKEEIRKDKNIKKEKKKTEFDELIEVYTNDNDLKNTIYEFIKMRKAIRSPMTSNALKLMLNKLDKLSYPNIDSQTKIDILNQSIMNSWKGIFQIKEDKKTNKSNFMDGMKELYDEARYFDEQNGVGTDPNNPW